MVRLLLGLIVHVLEGRGGGKYCGRSSASAGVILGVDCIFTVDLSCGQCTFSSCSMLCQDYTSLEVLNWITSSCLALTMEVHQLPPRFLDETYTARTCSSRQRQWYM